MSSGTIIGTVDEVIDQISAAAQSQGWRVGIYSRSERRVLVCLTEGRWRGFIRVQSEGLNQVSVRTKRSGLAATVLLAIVTILGLALSAGAYYALLLTGGMHPGSVGESSFVSLGYFVGFLFALLPARLIWLRRPSRVQLNHELDLMVDGLVVESGICRGSAGWS